MTMLSEFAKDGYLVDVDMLYSGAVLTITVMETETVYQIMASRRMMKVSRCKKGKAEQWEDIIHPDLTMDPLNPSNEEKTLVEVMMFSLNSFEKSLYELGCQLCRLYHNNADALYTKRYAENYLKENAA